MIVCQEAVNLLQLASNKVYICRMSLDLPEERFTQWERTLAYDVGQAAEFALKAYVYMNGHIPTGSHKHQDIVRECRQWGLKKCAVFDGKLPLLYSYQQTRYEIIKPINGDKVLGVLDLVDEFVDVLWNEYMPLVMDYCKKLPEVFREKVTDNGVPEEVVVKLPLSTVDE